MTAPRPSSEQAWFWTPVWQAGEREASRQIAAGGLRVHHDMDEMFAALDGPTEVEGC